MLWVLDDRYICIYIHIYFFVNTYLLYKENIQTPKQTFTDHTNIGIEDHRSYKHWIETFELFSISYLRRVYSFSLVWNRSFIY